MIQQQGGVFRLETEHTGYYIGLRDGLLENLHYGAKLHLAGDAPLREKLAAPYGTAVAPLAEKPGLSLEHLCLELSPLGKGDYRAPMLEVAMPGGTADFRFAAARRLQGSVPPAGLPGALGGAETLALDLATPEGLLATLVYTVYPACDVITRRLRLRNGTAAPVALRRAFSYQLDLPRADYTLATLPGAWARERHLCEAPLAPGARVFGSRTGVSSNTCNPFFFLAEPGADEFHGGVYGFNLIYSGSHSAWVEVSPGGKTRVTAGIQDEGFCWTLRPGESFSTPEAVLTFSAAGKNGMSANLHDFVNRHIVRGPWAGRERPVLFNNWEATYFDFNEHKLLKLAKCAAGLGAELFVLDDGWFGARDSDKAGLGDYTVNRKKLPGGLAGLAQKLAGLGLAFGLWMEPEMVNRDSALYRAHPDWVVQTPGNTPAEGRNQLVLDLCRTQVQEYIIEQVDTVLNDAPIRYVKWDMNRPLSDAFSPALAEQGRFYHSYVLGLYRVWSTLLQRHPDVLFESCASGGNRFDLGVLCYMPQIWTSDDTDAWERAFIQTGTSYGYPPSVMGCHVAACPNHQTARTTPLESRFNVAAFGVLGYELDLTQLTAAERKQVAAQISWYKAHRRLMQYGRFLRLLGPESGECRWAVVSEDGGQAVQLELMGLTVPNLGQPPMRFAGLCPGRPYRVTTRPQSLDIRSFGSLVNQLLPVKVNTGGLLVHVAAGHYALPCETEEITAYGDALMAAGLKRAQRFTGAGYAEGVRLMPDFSSRLYCLDAEKEEP